MNYTQRILQILNKPLLKDIKEGHKGWAYYKHRRVICGWEIGFHVPLNSSYEEAQKCLPALIATCGKEVELINFKGLLVCRIIEKDWPFPLRYKKEHLKQNQLLIGYDRLMQPVYHPLNVHILEGGASGAGKTDWQRWIAYQLLLQGYEVYICDMKGYSFSPFEGLVTVADDLKSCRKILMGLVKELERRKAVIQSREFGNREETVATFKPIVVLIDEAADLSPSQYAARTLDKELAFECDYAIGFIGRKGREPKVFCIYGTQRPDARVINKQFKDNVEASIAFRTKDHFGSQIIIDRPGAEKINPKDKGRCIYSHGEDILVQTPYIGGDREWERLLAPLKKGMIIENGNSKRSNKERSYTEGSFTSSDSSHGSDSKTIQFKLQSAKEGFSAPSGSASGKTNRMGMAQENKNMASNTQGPTDDEWI